MTRAAATWRTWIAFAMFFVAMMPLSSALAQSGTEDPGAVGSGERHEKFACASDHADPSYKSRVGIPRIDLQKPVIQGSLDKLIVKRVAKHNMGGLRECYKQELVRRPTAEGVIEVRFLIGPRGEVMVSHIYSDTIGSEELRVCLKKKTSAWVFPQPKGSTVQVTYPIEFYLEVPATGSTSSTSSSYYGAVASGESFVEVSAAPEDAVSCGSDASSGNASAARSGGIPKITARPVTVGPGGALSKEVIRRVIRKHRGELDACYKRRMVRQSKGGKVNVEFHIDGKGAITSARLLDNTLRDGKVEDCLVDAIRTWRFPEPRGGGTVIVKYPFEFKPVTPAQLADEDAESEK